MIRQRASAVAVLAAPTSGPAAAQIQCAGPKGTLNVSYDIARELYIELDAAFVAERKATSGIYDR